MFNFTSNTKNRQQTLPTDPAAAQTAKAPATAAGTQNSQMPQSTQSADPYVEQRIDEIESQRIAFQRQNPDFDMKAEMQNPDFVNYVWGKGLTVEEAYFLAHRQELLNQARSEAMEELMARRERIAENGAAKNRPAIAKKNPKDLSDKEIDAIIERVRKGEKITF